MAKGSVCAKCRSVSYCSRDCQKADWKIHKKVCSKTPGNTPTSSGKNSPFTSLDQGTWMHDRPKEEIYKLLIDSYRLRMEDEYTFTGDADVDSIYGGSADGRRGFRRFVGLAHARPGLLPSWWNLEHSLAAEDFGMQEGEWSDLRCCVEKSDIIEHYKDKMMPMQLRMLAEAVYGTGLNGQGPEAAARMRQLMMMSERAK